MDVEGTKRRPIWKHPLVLLVLFGLAVLVAVPLVGTIAILAHWTVKDRSPADDIRQILHRNFEVSLPDGSSVVASHRVLIGMDSAGAYELDIPAAALPAFMEQVRTAAAKQGYEINETAAAPFISNPPPWWSKGTAGITKWLELLHSTDQAYTIGISPTTGHCFIYWMTF